MSILDDLRSLDPHDPGRWPLPVRVGTVVLCFVVLAVACSTTSSWQNQQPRARARAAGRAGAAPRPSRRSIRKAANLDVYKQQLKDIERSFGALLRQLPGKTEVPNLLVDISQTGLAAGLRRNCSSRRAKCKKDFYAELPIKIRLTGSYHQLGEFVSGIAALPRIVTLHDIEIKPESKDSLRPAVARADGEDLPLSRRRRSRSGETAKAANASTARRHEHGSTRIRR